MEKSYSTQLVLRLTKATSNQLKYWIKCGFVEPSKQRGNYYFSFRDVILLRTVVSLKEQGLSLQKIRKGIKNLLSALPQSEDSLTRLIIYTNGLDMIVCDKGIHFSAISKQQYLLIDTERIQDNVVKIQPFRCMYLRDGDALDGRVLHNVTRQVTK